MVSSCWCFKGEHGIAITLMFFKPLVTSGDQKLVVWIGGLELGARPCFLIKTYYLFS